MNTFIGICSICGGQVAVPTEWLGIFPPRPTCMNCGALAKEAGPVIPMEPFRPVPGPQPTAPEPYPVKPDGPASCAAAQNGGCFCTGACYGNRGDLRPFWAKIKDKIIARGQL